MAFSARFWLSTPHSSCRCRETPRERRDVLGGLAHREVDVGEQAVLARVGPRRVGAGHLGGARRGIREAGVLGVGVAAAGPGEARVLRDALDAADEERVALARLDRVERHPHRLGRAGAEPVHGRGRQVVHAGEHRDDAGEVRAVLAARVGAAPVQVVDGRRGPAPGSCSSSPCTTCTDRSSGRTSLSEPLNARPMGVRAVATTTASVTGAPRVRRGGRRTAAGVHGIRLTRAQRSSKGMPGDRRARVWRRSRRGAPAARGAPTE